MSSFDYGWIEGPPRDRDFVVFNTFMHPVNTQEVSIMSICEPTGHVFTGNFSIDRNYKVSEVKSVDGVISIEISGQKGFFHMKYFRRSNTGSYMSSGEKSTIKEKIRDISDRLVQKDIEKKRIAKDKMYHDYEASSYALSMMREANERFQIRHPVGSISDLSVADMHYDRDHERQRRSLVRADCLPSEAMINNKRIDIDIGHGMSVKMTELVEGVRDIAGMRFEGVLNRDDQSDILVIKKLNKLNL